MGPGNVDEGPEGSEGIKLVELEDLVERVSRNLGIDLELEGAGEEYALWFNNAPPDDKHVLVFDLKAHETVVTCPSNPSGFRKFVSCARSGSISQSLLLDPPSGDGEVVRGVPGDYDPDDPPGAA